jgi:hypothetical protein
MMIHSLFGRRSARPVVSISARTHEVATSGDLDAAIGTSIHVGNMPRPGGGRRTSMRIDRDPPRAKATRAARRAFMLTLLLAMVPVGCASLRPLPPGGLSLVVFKSDWHELRLGYEAAPALSTLRSVSLADPLFRAEPADVEEYRWSTETLVLTSSATSRLVAALSRTSARQEGIEKLNGLKESLGDHNLLSHALYVRPFVVLLGQERVYGGIFLDGESQMAIDFPVARVRLEDKRAVLHFLPVHLPFYETDPGVDPTAGDDRPRDVPGEMMDHFRRAAMSEIAVENRKLLQDPRIRSWLAAAGKLR